MNISLNTNLNTNLNMSELETKTLTQLRDMAREMDLSGYSGLTRNELVFRLLEAGDEQPGYLFGSGVLEVVDEGFGFLRREQVQPSSTDVYVSQTQIRRFGLRT